MLFRCWALTENGSKYDDLKEQIDNLVKISENEKKEDPYFIALVVCTLHNVGHIEQAELLGEKLTELQSEEGRLGKDSRSSNFTTYLFFFFWFSF